MRGVCTICMAMCGVVWRLIFVINRYFVTFTLLT